MRLLVIRTSAMGDVALTTPVIKAMGEQYPDVEIVLLTRPFFRPFFTSCKNVSLFLTGFKGRYEGLAGLIRLRKDILSSGKIDKVIDLHDVVRSKVLRLTFRLRGVPFFVID